MRWTLLALLLLQPAPTLCAPLADCTDANARERVHALEMELKAERRKQESDRRKQESDRRKQESDRRKLAAKILELEGRLNAADRAQDPSESMPSSRSSSPATNDGAPSGCLAFPGLKSTTTPRTPSRTPTSPSHTVDALTFAAATGESAYCGSRVPPTARS